jgi:hypothetical protein
MREVHQSPTRRSEPSGETLLGRALVVLYDTSPFTDPAV